MNTFLLVVQVLTDLKYRIYTMGGGGYHSKVVECSIDDHDRYHGRYDWVFSIGGWEWRSLWSRLSIDWWEPRSWLPKSIYANSPGYDTDLPVSRIKSSYELPYSSKIRIFLIHSSVFGVFLYVFHHWQRLSCQYNHNTELWSILHVRLNIMSEAVLRHFRSRRSLLIFSEASSWLFQGADVRMVTTRCLRGAWLLNTEHKISSYCSVKTFKSSDSFCKRLESQISLKRKSMSIQRSLRKVTLFLTNSKVSGDANHSALHSDQQFQGA